MRMALCTMLAVGGCGGPARTAATLPEVHARPALQVEQALPRIELAERVSQAVPGTPVSVTLVYLKAGEAGLSGRHGIKCAPPRSARAILELRRDDAVEWVGWTTGSYERFGFTWHVRITDNVVRLEWRPAAVSSPG